MTAMEFREELKRMHREFPRPKREQETVGDWALRLFEHQFELCRLISKYFGAEFADPDDAVPAEIQLTPAMESSATVVRALNWLLDQERRRRV